ncbi:Respiratory supercomplex factor 1, mitochondrial [Mucor velutinosus]|uniref:Endosomal/vacuolar adapter protein YPT35 n=1 Tax=Mucor velutinosus TaxID=708070 RepID=A0AAN7DS97_9FUNG|nr:Respiratory supercomplex factor 1, mitochondrial [Mucor velutinosus]
MTNYQQRISDLLECCQNEWVTLEALAREPNATSSIHYASKDLREGIKKLVQLQDNLDDIGTIVANNSEWNKKADILMEDVRKKLQFASKLTANVKPQTSQSSPLRLSTSQSFKSTTFTHNTTINTHNNTNDTPNSISDIKEEDEEEEEEGEEQFLDASEELPEQVASPVDFSVEPTSSSDFIKPSRSSSSSSLSKTQESKPAFGRRSILADEDMKVVNKEKKMSIFPLLKGLKTSQSTPINGAQAQINFFKNDNVEPDAKHFIFATDAIVDHPLRIGVGYGSYICYSCTILSDKGAPITVRKRYSDFVELREELVKQYPTLKRSIPKLPPKKVVGKFTPAFVEQRRRDLEYFFKYVVLHPTLGASPIVRHWIAP